ncbi:hypothetical protein OAS39_08255 [Pirellulales bacterium]|nr:hypothetical protein [Pirellulales bacterium]
MRPVHEEQLIGPARYVLRSLDSCLAVRYSKRFYDGSLALHEQLINEIGVTSEEDAAQIESLLDEAIDQLEEQGIVKITPLDTNLADGDKDTVIELTETGKKVMKNEAPFELFERYYERDRPAGYRAVKAE